MLITIGKCQVPLRPRHAPGSLPRKDRLVFYLGFPSWKDDKAGSGGDEEKHGMNQVTTSSPQKADKINP